MTAFPANEDFRPGQRWTSETEPELGLGSIVSVSAHTVTVSFGTSGETRVYARDNAPLRRVRFRAGDTVADHAGKTWEVEAVMERDGRLHYGMAGRPEPMPECDLGDVVGGGGPEENLRAGRLDPPGAFALRLRALEHQHRRRQSPVRGFAGGRIDLIPHQLFIASEVTQRLRPRVLLADEVGLGKTIEAGLIVHRLLLTGRARRVLILVPESLVHQWFVELLRRFNQWFHIFDEERCQAIEASHPDVNPFLDDQVVLAGLGLIAGQPRRLEQALAAEWDLLVVDEAHHLGWSREKASPEYEAVEALARVADGLLLLTATPEQLGLASHFARLRLLDPDRFFDLDEFVRETAGYREVAALADQLATGAGLEDAAARRLAAVLGRPEPEVRAGLATAAGSAEGMELRRRWVAALLDQHGTGRVMFRNTRATITGFPRRVAHLVALPGVDDDDEEEAIGLLAALAEELADDARPATAPGTGSGGTFVPEYDDDPRIDWLAGLLRGLGKVVQGDSSAPSLDAQGGREPATPHPAPPVGRDRLLPRSGGRGLLRDTGRGEEKILLICRTRSKVEAIEAALRRRLTIKMAVFHEGLTLVKRDRNAAWFAEEDGARLLLCSEIGSEGRNFQFAHHLVLFDLPFDPELLEQRLGRLDRIGQRAEIQVHVPFVADSPQEVVAHWYHRGLNSFEKNLQGGRELMERFGPRVFDLAQDFHETHANTRLDLERLIQETAEARIELAARLEAGRDRLLELNSHRPERASDLVKAIQQQDADRTLDDFMLAVFDHYNIHVEEVNHRTFQLGSAGVFADAFPGLPAGGLTVTGDRSRALAREDVQFLTWDHPLVTGALDLLLGAGTGNCSFALWPGGKPAGLLVEAVFLLECIAPLVLHVDRFLPPTPVRIVVDQRGVELSGEMLNHFRSAALKPGDPRGILDQAAVRDDLVPALLETASGLAETRAGRWIAEARRLMAAQLAGEIDRLRELAKVNRSVRPEEIDHLMEQKDALDHHLSQARIRLDALRVIVRQ